MKRLMIILAMLALLTACSIPAPLPENPYTAADFEYRDGYLTCTAGECRLGVDVSSHEGDIDWQTVADSGVEFAMVRIGYRRYLEGGIVEDPNAGANIEGAKAAGLDVGAYFFSQAVTTQEAEEEAAWAAAYLENTELDLPLVFDWEHVGSSEARTAGLEDRKLLTACARSFCDVVRAAGYEPMVYFNVYQSRDLYDLKALQDCGFWLARYRDGLDFPYAVDLWQYTENGEVPGIPDKVDLNLWLPRAEE